MCARWEHAEACEDAGKGFPPWHGILLPSHQAKTLFQDSIDPLHMACCPWVVGSYDAVLNSEGGQVINESSLEFSPTVGPHHCWMIVAVDDFCMESDCDSVAGGGGHGHPFDPLPKGVHPPTIAAVYPRGDGVSPTMQSRIHIASGLMPFGIGKRCHGRVKTVFSFCHTTVAQTRQSSWSVGHQ